MSAAERAARAERLEPVVLRSARADLARGAVARDGGAEAGESYRVAAEAALARLRGYVQRWT